MSIKKGIKINQKKRYHPIAFFDAVCHLNSAAVDTASPNFEGVFKMPKVVNLDVVKPVKIQPDEIDRLAYSAVFANWRKSWGTAPTNEQLRVMHVLCARPGSKHAFACAMFSRPNEGAHDFEQVWPATQYIKPVDGLPQTLHNYRDGLERAGYFTRQSTKHHSQLTITALGAKVYGERLKGNSPAVARAAAIAAKVTAAQAQAQAAAKAAAKAKAKATREAKRAAKVAAATEVDPLSDSTDRMLASDFSPPADTE